LRLGSRGDETSRDDVDIQYARYSMPRYYLEAKAFSSDVSSRQRARLCYSQYQATSSAIDNFRPSLEHENMAFDIPTTPTLKTPPSRSVNGGVDGLILEGKTPSRRRNGTAEASAEAQARARNPDGG
jgi:hypothetical protein